MSTRFAWIVAAALLSAGCATSPFGGNKDNIAVAADDFVESESPLVGADLDGLWERGKQVLGVEGYAVDGERTNFADRELVTRWNAVLGMNRYEGYRTRAWVRFKKAADAKSKGGTTWTIAVSVQRQRNGDIRRPSEISLAQWEEQPSDKQRAGVILWKIESGFHAPGSDATTTK